LHSIDDSIWIKTIGLLNSFYEIIPAIEDTETFDFLFTLATGDEVEYIGEASGELIEAKPLDRTQAAADHYRDLLRLHPADNQGNRECLAACLIELGRWDELERLVERCDEDAACWWDYCRALLQYRRTWSPSFKARLFLEEAREANPQVPEYLSGKRRMPRGLPELVRLGESVEAAAFAALFGRALSRHPAMLEWMCA
jgi:hypothetical protein